MVAVVADVGQQLPGAVGDEGVTGEGGGIQALDRGQGGEVLLGVDVAHPGQHQATGEEHGEQPKAAVAASPLPQWRPESVDPGAGPVPLRSFELL